jgi:hypothetical protein
VHLISNRHEVTQMPQFHAGRVGLRLIRQTSRALPTPTLQCLQCTDSLTVWIAIRLVSSLSGAPQCAAAEPAASPELHEAMSRDVTPDARLAARRGAPHRRC